MRARPKRGTVVANMDAVKQILEVAPIKVGSGSRVVVMFFDLECPFCARMFLEAEQVLIELASKGKVVYAVCDFLVHPTAEKKHSALRCLPEDKRLEVVEKIYKGEGVELPDCNSGDVHKCTELGLKLGVYGTPTVLAFDLNKGIGVVRMGYMTPDQVLELIEQL